jgi:hypothetical protein
VRILGIVVHQTRVARTLLLYIPSFRTKQDYVTVVNRKKFKSGHLCDTVIRNPERSAGRLPKIGGLLEEAIDNNPESAFGLSLSEDGAVSLEANMAFA